MELVIVALLLGILVLAILPKMLTTTEISATAAAEMAAAAIRAAQHKAMFTGSTITILFNGASYTLDGRTTNLPGSAIADNQTITFNSFGEPTTGGGAFFNISCHGDSATIAVASLTGKVTIN